MSENNNKCDICGCLIEKIENGHCKEYQCNCDTIVYELGVHIGAEKRAYSSREEA